MDDPESDTMGWIMPIDFLPEPLVARNEFVEWAAAAAFENN